MSFCGSGAMAADLRVGVSSEATTLDPHFFRLGSNTEVHKLIYSALVNRLMEGLAKPASQLLPAGSSGTSSRMQPQPFDLAGARRLLTEAG